MSADLNITSPIDGFYGICILPGLHLGNISDSLTAVVKQLFAEATSPYPLHFRVSETTKTYSDFWGYYKESNGPLDAGSDQVLGSRLLDKKALMENVPALAEAFRIASPTDARMGVFLVGGKGVQNAKPRGGSNAVNPAWRIAYAHSVVGLSSLPFDNKKRADQEKRLNGTYLDALRKLAPDTGAYVNEAFPHEPDWQHPFWGDNYERLLAIKRKFDPCDVLWCHPCVGNENWEVVENILCRR